ncbi:uncharacterized protein LOC119165060 isoform X2 [Rhipicephalus microplus]|uniref:uncharacterized protein LOC119165060 isoform X2 n=1 Tax=Rhipicephalus microplus TaxID=6941 RepID=UPI003F6C7DEB
MALRMVVGCFIFCAACYAVYRWLPGLRECIDLPVKIGTLRRAPTVASAYKEKRDTGPEGTGVSASCPATHSDGACLGDHGEESLEHSDSIARRLWLRVQTLLSEHMMDTLVPPDVQALLQEAWDAMKNKHWLQGFTNQTVSMLLTAIFCIIMAMRCCNSTHKKNTSEVEPSPAPPVDAVAVDWKSVFSISEMARLDSGSNRHEGGYIYSKVGLRKSMQSILYEKLMEILVPDDLRIIYRAVRRAWQRMEWPQWIADVDWDIARLLLLSSLLWIGIATLYFRGGTENRKKEIDASPESTASEPPAGAESSLLECEVARHALQACRHEGGYIYSKGSNQLRKEDAAAATIQRWSRTKLKRWLREHALSRPSIETSPVNSQRWIDDDHGAVVTTVLKDRDVSVDTLGPPEGGLHSRNKAALEKGLFESARRGGDHVDSRRHTWHRQKFSLTSKKISDSLLSLESHANSRASYSPASKPP